jgi:hypothetical protein
MPSATSRRLTRRAKHQHNPIMAVVHLPALSTSPDAAIFDAPTPCRASLTNFFVLRLATASPKGPFVYLGIEVDDALSMSEQFEL